MPIAKLMSRDESCDVTIESYAYAYPDADNIHDGPGIVIGSGSIRRTIASRSMTSCSTVCSWLTTYQCSSHS